MCVRWVYSFPKAFALAISSLWGAPFPSRYLCPLPSHPRQRLHNTLFQVTPLAARESPCFVLISTEHTLWLTYLPHCLGLCSGCFRPAKPLLGGLYLPGCSISYTDVCLTSVCQALSGFAFGFWEFPRMGSAVVYWGWSQTASEFPLRQFRKKQAVPKRPRMETMVQWMQDWEFRLALAA